MLSSYSRLMVHVEPGEASEARVRLAANLAERWNAELIGIASSALEPIVIGAVGLDMLDPELVEEDRKRAELDLVAAEQQFRSLTGDRRVSWRATFDAPGDALARECRAADLVIIGREQEPHLRRVYRAADPGDVLMRAGRPILVVPPGTGVLTAKRVVVGWKETREARRAVRDALPILAQVEHVLVLEVCAEEEANEASARTGDVAAYLRTQGVRAGAQVRHRHEETVADELVLAAEQEGADLIVVGGYGHARLREWVFGGVTRDLLGRCPKCCLMAH